MVGENMNITFIIGNGFDLGLGLKSSYEDFYNEYCVVTENDNVDRCNRQKVVGYHIKVVI